MPCTAAELHRRLCLNLEHAPVQQASMPEARKFIDAGEMITDNVVGDILLEAILKGAEGQSGHEYGLVVDGFPRTALQVQQTRVQSV